MLPTRLVSRIAASGWLFLLPALLEAKSAKHEYASIARAGLICFGALPPSKYGDGSWSAQDFIDLTDLCSVQGNPRANMGGRCVYNADPRRSKVVFPEVPETHSLFDIDVLDACEDACMCKRHWKDNWNAEARKDVASDWKAMLRKLRQSVGRRQMPNVLLKEMEEKGSFSSYRSSVSGSSYQYCQTHDGQHACDSKVPSPDATPTNPPSEQTCGSKCRNFRCSEQGQGCVCQASKVANSLWAITGCVSLLGRKREDTACPCNGTYVSNACCHSQNGMVWESPQNFLGLIASEMVE